MKTRPTTRTLLAMSAALLSLLAACDGDDDAPRRHPCAHTAYGSVEGIADAATGTWSWKGVPFAAPPVGALRWKAPVDPDAVDRRAPGAQASATPACSTAASTAPAPTTPTTRPSAPRSNQAVGSEDCLYLNIWRPASDAGDLPVIVFIHGGSNVSGYTADPVYDGADAGQAPPTRWW